MFRGEGKETREMGKEGSIESAETPKCLSTDTFLFLSIVHFTGETLPQLTDGLMGTEGMVYEKSEETDEGKENSEMDEKTRYNLSHLYQIVREVGKKVGSKYD